MEFQLYKPIPAQSLADIACPATDFIEEPLVKVKNRGRIATCPQYYMQKIEGAVSAIYVRKNVLDLLIRAGEQLPDHYKFMLYDAWRPYAVQKYLFDRYMKILGENPLLQNLDQEALMEKASVFVSLPSTDPYHPFVHATGGAVDLTIVNENDDELDMGTGFDAFDDRAFTRYFEESENSKIKNNRRLLYNIMTSVGFTNLSSEWWHFDYGDYFWARTTGKPAIYKGIFSL